MSAPDILWDVYKTPRLDAVQFGKYFAADHGGREPILRAAKYCSRGHRATGKEARDTIRKYVTAAIPKLGALDAAKEKFSDRLNDPARSDEQHENDLTNLQSIEKFLAHWDQGKLGGKVLEALPSDQPPMDVGGLLVRMQIDFLIRGTDKAGADTVGGVFLNTQKGEGLGTKPETITKRTKGGEAIALLVLQRIINEYADDAAPHYADCWHYYIRQKHIWLAPKSHTKKRDDISAAGKTAVAEWGQVTPPAGFDPKRAEFHA